MIALVALVWAVAAWVGAVLLCRHFALRAQRERIWRGIVARRRGSGDRLTPAMRDAVRAAQARLVRTRA